jgi:hypothetical protein
MCMPPVLPPPWFRANSHACTHPQPPDADGTLPTAQLHDENVESMRVLLSGDLRTELPQRVLVVSAISYFGQLLLANPHTEASLAGLRIGRQPFMHAAHFLLRPARTIAAAVDSFYLTHMAGRHIIGLHLRTIEYMTARELGTALRCARFLAQGNASSIFVASDTAAGLWAAEEELGPHFLQYSTLPPGRAGDAALADGWANLVLLRFGGSGVGRGGGIVQRV